VKRIGRNHDAAIGLWESGVHDARIVATMIAEPEKMTRTGIERWLSECTNYVLTDAVSAVAAEMPGGLEMARSWIERDGEWVTTAGWNVVASKGPRGTLSANDVDGLLDQIETTIHSQPNRTRYAMNNVLIGIGGYVDTLRPRALEVAKAIGTVHVDHGETGCATPDASAYIKKMVAHRAAKSTGKRKTSAKASASTRRAKTRAEAKTRTKTKTKTKTTRKAKAQKKR
jgi:hypothetical protein